MKAEETAIGPSLFLSLLIIPSLGYGLLNLPFYASQSMGANGYLGVLAAALMTLPGLAVIQAMARRFPGQTIIDYGQSILGPIAGRVTGLLYLCFNLVLLAMFTRDQINLASAYFLDRTPLWVVSLSLLLAAAYLASRGIETISRLACFTLLPALLVMLVLLMAGLQNVTLTHLLPVFDGGIQDYLKGGFSVLYIFYLMGASAMILPVLRPGRSFPRLALGALSILVFFFISFSIGAIGTYGYQHLDIFAWPSLDYVHAIDLPYFLLEQAGLLMLIDWIALIYIATGFLTYLAALGLSQVIGVLDYKKNALLLLPFTCALVLLPDGVAATKWAFDLIRRIGFIFYFAYPFVLWLIALVLRRKGRGNEA